MGSKHRPELAGDWLALKAQDGEYWEVWGQTGKVGPGGGG